MLGSRNSSPSGSVQPARLEERSLGPSGPLLCSCWRLPKSSMGGAEACDRDWQGVADRWLIAFPSPGRPRSLRIRDHPP